MESSKATALAWCASNIRKGDWPTLARGVKHIPLEGTYWTYCSSLKEWSLSCSNGERVSEKDWDDCRNKNKNKKLKDKRERYGEKQTKEKGLRKCCVFVDEAGAEKIRQLGKQIRHDLDAAKLKTEMEENENVGE